MQVQRNLYVWVSSLKTSSTGLGPPPARAFSPSFTISDGEDVPKITVQAKQGSQGVKTNYIMHHRISTTKCSVELAGAIVLTVV